jgi:hypothetical protein
MKKKSEPEYLVQTIKMVVADRNGRKKMNQMVGDGWEVVATTKTAFNRATTVTFRKPNPNYVPEA